MTPTSPLRSLALLCCLLLTGCAKPLPPHVYLPVPRVQAVDLFWWTDTRQCSMRVVFLDRDLPKGFTVPADPSLCLAWLKADGYDVSKFNVVPVVTTGAMPSAKDGAK